MKPISQQSIAKEMGVSQAVVSLVLNGHRNRVSSKTFEKIWEFAIKNGYKPKGIKLNNPITSPQTTQYVGYILRAPLKFASSSNYFTYVLEGMDAYLRPQQIHTVFYGSEHDIDLSKSVKLMKMDPQLQGIVIMGEVEDNFLDAIIETEKKIVYVSARRPGLCHSVNANETQASHLLIEHLYALGHRHFAFIGCDVPKSRNDERYANFCSALKKYNLALKDSCYIKNPTASRADGLNAAEKLYEKNKKNIPTAWICAGGFIARGAIDFTFRKSIKVGAEVSISTYDMTRVCTDESPTITSALTNPMRLGEEAAKLIINPPKMEQNIFIDLVIPSALEVRESTGPCLPQ